MAGKADTVSFSLPHKWANCSILSIQGHNQLCKMSPKIRAQNKASQHAQVSALNVMAAAGMTSSVFRDQKHKPVGKNNAFTSDVRCLHTLVGPMLECYSSTHTQTNPQILADYVPSRAKSFLHCKLIDRLPTMCKYF